MSSPEAIEQFEALCWLEDYLKQGGHIKKDCWLKPMHVRYSPFSEKYELVDSCSRYDGGRVLCVRESYNNISDIPYVGKWLKCNEKGELIDGDN